MIGFQMIKDLKGKMLNVPPILVFGSEFKQIPISAPNRKTDWISNEFEKGKRLNVTQFFISQY